jgi:hypothetical protein
MSLSYFYFYYTISLLGYIRLRNVFLIIFLNKLLGFLAHLYNSLVIIRLLEYKSFIIKIKGFIFINLFINSLEILI